MSAGIPSSEPIPMPTARQPSVDLLTPSSASPPALYPSLEGLDLFPGSPSSGRRPMHAPPLADHFIKIEPMGAVAIFALLRFYPADSLIGIDTTNGELEIQTCKTWSEYIITTGKRMYKGQNGDQLHNLEEPIKTACQIYDPSNQDVGIIFLFAYLGAEQLKQRYEEKKKPLAVTTLEKIISIFYNHVLKCHSLKPLPSIVTPHICLPITHFAPPAGKVDVGFSQSPPGEILQPTFYHHPSATWKYDDLKQFASGILAICQGTALKQDNTPQREDLMRRIQLLNMTYRNAVTR